MSETMKPLVHRAIFTGDNSLGYTNGNMYQIIISFGLYQNRGAMWVERTDGTGRCPYSSIPKLLENWHIVEPKDIFGNSTELLQPEAVGLTETEKERYPVQAEEN